MLAGTLHGFSSTGHKFLRGCTCWDSTTIH
jgi:hypothetical protein